MVSRPSAAAAAFVAVALTGCIVIPIPTPEWGDAPISEEQNEVLESGVGRMTRDEVIGLIGQPQRRYGDGSVIVYDWTMSQGIYFYGVANQGGVAAGESEHRLCFLFSEEGVLKSIEHIDSAIGGSESMVARQLEEWLGEIATDESIPDLAHDLDVDAVRLIQPKGKPEGTIGVLLHSHAQADPSCIREFESIFDTPYRIYSHRELRNRFYPWLEPPWYGNLETLSNSPLVRQSRTDTDLRFAVVVADERSAFPDDLCKIEAPYTVSCYIVAFEDQSGKVALIDLQRSADGISGAIRSNRMPRIPKFPTSRRAVCRTITAYVAHDINTLMR